MQRPVAAAAGVGDAAPVDRLEAERQRDDEVAGVRGAQRRPDPGQRVRVGRRCAAARPSTVASSTAGSPSSSQRAAAQVGDLVAGPEAQLSRPPRSTTAHSPSPGGGPGSSRRSGAPLGVLQPADQVDALDHGQLRRDRRPGRRARPRPAAGRRGPARPVGLTASWASSGRSSEGCSTDHSCAEQLGQRQAAVDVGLGVVGDAGSARGSSRKASRPPAASTNLAKQWSALAIDSTLASGPCRCE